MKNFKHQYLEQQKLKNVTIFKTKQKKTETDALFTAFDLSCLLIMTKQKFKMHYNNVI